MIYGKLNADTEISSNTKRLGIIADMEYQSNTERLLIDTEISIDTEILSYDVINTMLAWLVSLHGTVHVVSTV